MAKLFLTILHIVVDCLLVLAAIQDAAWASLAYAVAWIALSLWAISVWKSKTQEERKLITRSYVTTYGAFIIIEIILVLLISAGGVALSKLVVSSFLLGYFLNPFSFRILFGRLRFFAKDTVA